MSDNLQSQAQQVISERPSSDAAMLTASAASLIKFQNWVFSGAGSNLFVQVSISPGSQTGAIQYALVVLQTTQGVALCQGSIKTSNAQAGTLNISADVAIYDIGTYGDQVQAYAYAQILGGGSQYSPIQTFTVSR